MLIRITDTTALAAGCPRCHAEPGQDCTTRRGKPSVVHLRRFDAARSAKRAELRAAMTPKEREQEAMWQVAYRFMVLAMLTVGLAVAAAALTYNLI